MMPRHLIRSLAVRSASGLPVHVAASPAVPFSTSLRFAPNAFTAVLLAGGESRRMGTDKATFVFRGKPLWEVQLETLRRLQPAGIFVSARTDPSWRPDDVHFVADTLPSRGPLSGLAAALDRINTSHLLALAIDMPWMSDTYLEFLCAHIEPGRGVVPTIGRRAEPLAAIYPRHAAVEFHNALRGQDFSVQSVLCDLVASGKISEQPVAEAQKELFRNANVASELQCT